MSVLRTPLGSPGLDATPEPRRGVEPGSGRLAGPPAGSGGLSAGAGGQPGGAGDRAADLSMSLLAAGIPLTLLLDLAENFGPPSADILAAEDQIDPSTPTRVA